MEKPRAQSTTIFSSSIANAGSHAHGIAIRSTEFLLPQSLMGWWDTICAPSAMAQVRDVGRATTHHVFCSFVHVETRQ